MRNGEGLVKQTQVSIGRQYKSRTTYPVSCWGKWMGMSAAGSRRRVKQYAASGGPDGWLLPRLNDASLLRRRHHNQATTATATASVARYTALCGTVAYHDLLHCSNVSRPLFHLLRDAITMRGEFIPPTYVNARSANSLNLYLSTSEKKNISIVDHKL